jgi:hypothetical protein
LLTTGFSTARKGVFTPGSFLTPPCLPLNPQTGFAFK